MTTQHLSKELALKIHNAVPLSGQDAYSISQEEIHALCNAAIEAYLASLGGEELSDGEMEAAYEEARRTYQHHKSSIRGQILMPEDDPNWHYAKAIERQVATKYKAKLAQRDAVLRQAREAMEWDIADDVKQYRLRDTIAAINELIGEK